MYFKNHVAQFVPNLFHFLYNCLDKNGSLRPREISYINQTIEYHHTLMLTAINAAIKELS